MAEKTGFLASKNTLRHHSYLLLCQLFASDEIAKLQYLGSAPDVFSDLLELEEDELDKHFMSLAALARINDDARGGLAEHLKEHPDGVGTLELGGSTEVLSAREACNKIIHSDDATLEFVTTTDHPVYAEILLKNRVKDSNTYRVPHLILEGKLPGKNGRTWKADINIIKWVLAVTYFSAVY